jgi:hypothetical protein
LFLTVPFWDQCFLVFHSITLPLKLATDPLGIKSERDVLSSNQSRG